MEEWVAPLLTDAQALINAVKRCYAKKVTTQHFYTQLAIVDEGEQREKEKANLQKDSSAENKPDTPERLLPSYEAIYGSKKTITNSDIFDNSETKKVLVLGRAGIGKTTFCEHLAHQWATGKLWADEFSLVVLIPLRKLTDAVIYDTKENCTLANIIYEEYLSQNTDITLEQIETFLKTFSGKILYLLDGFDEVSAFLDNSNKQGEETKAAQTSLSELEQIQLQLAKAKLAKIQRETQRIETAQRTFIQKLLDHESFILTSRPYGVEGRFEHLSLRKLENIGFSDESIDSFIESYFEKCAPTSLAKTLTEGLKTFIQNNPNIRGIAHIPINLKFICSFWRNHSHQLNSTTDQSFSMTDLYTHIVNDSCIESMSKKNMAPQDSTWVFETPAFQGVMAFLGQLAFTQMERKELIIPAEEINLLQRRYSAEPGLFDRVLALGLLKSTGEVVEKYKDRENYYFVHLTFQEFFAAWHIAHKIKTRESDIYHFIRDNKYDPRYEIMWWFVAGLLRTHGSTSDLEIFFGILESSPRDLLQSYHTTLVLRCMDECRLAVSPKRKGHFVESFCRLIDFALTEFNILKRSNIYLTRAVRFQYRLKNYLKLCPTLFNEPEVIEKFVALLSQYDLAKGRGTHCRAIDLLYGQPYLPNELCSRITELILRIKDREYSALLWSLSYFSSSWRSSSLLSKHHTILTPDVVNFILSRNQKLGSNPFATKAPLRTLAFTTGALPVTFVEEMQTALESGKASERKEAIQFFTYYPGELCEKTIVAIIHLLHAIDGDHISLEDKTKTLAISFFEKRTIQVTEAIITAMMQLFPEADTKVAIENYLSMYPNSGTVRIVVDLTKFSIPRPANPESKLLFLDDSSTQALQTFETISYIKNVRVHSTASQDEINDGITLLFYVSSNSIKLRALNYFIEKENAPSSVIVRIIAERLWGKDKRLIESIAKFFQKHSRALTPEIAEYILSILGTSAPHRERLFFWGGDGEEHVRSLRNATAIRLLKNHCTKESREVIRKLFLKGDSETIKAAQEYFDANPNTLENIDEIKAWLFIPIDSLFSFDRTSDKIVHAIRFFQNQRAYHTDDVVEQIKKLLLITSSSAVLRIEEDFFGVVNQVKDLRSTENQTIILKSAKDFFHANPQLVEDKTEVTEKVVAALAKPALLTTPDFYINEVRIALSYFEQNPDQLSDKIASEIHTLLSSPDSVAELDKDNEPSESPELIRILGDFPLFSAHLAPDEDLKKKLYDFFMYNSKYRVNLSDIQTIIHEYDEQKFSEVIRRRQSTVAFVMFFSTRATAQDQEIDEVIVKWLYSEDSFLVEGAIYYFAEKTTLLPEKIVGCIIEHLFHSTGFVKQAAIRFFEKRFCYANTDTIQKIAALITAYSDEEYDTDEEDEPTEKYDAHARSAALNFFVKHPNARNKKTMKKMEGFLWKHNRYKKQFAIYFFADCPVVKPRIARRIKKILLTERYYFVINACLSFIYKHPAEFSDDIPPPLISHLKEPYKKDGAEDDETRDRTIKNSFYLLLEHRPTVLIDELVYLFEANFEAEKFSEYSSTRNDYYVCSFDRWDSASITCFLRKQKKLPVSAFQAFGKLLYRILHEKNSEEFNANEKNCMEVITSIIGNRSLAELITAICERDRAAPLLFFVYLLALKLWNLDIAVTLQNSLIKLGNTHQIPFDTPEEAAVFAQALQAIFSKAQPEFLSDNEENFWVEHSKFPADLAVETPDFFKDYEVKDFFWTEQLPPLLPETPLSGPKFFEEQTDVCRNAEQLEALRIIGQKNPSTKKPKIFIHYARKLEPQDEKNMKDGGLNEQWTDCFAIRLAEHLKLIGFDVILDFTSSRAGNSMYYNMQKFVYEADHVLMLYTKTYAHKFKHWWIPSIKVELSFMKERVRKEGFLSATERRFTIPIICTEASVEGGFPHFDGTGGNVSDFFTEGYIETLRKIAHNIFGVAIKPHTEKHSSAQLLSMCGLNKSPTYSPPTSHSSSIGNNNNVRQFK